MIYIETRFNIYYEIEYYLKKLFPKVKIFQAKLTNEMIDFGFSADNPYVVGFNMSRNDFTVLLEKLQYIDWDEELAGLEDSPSKAGWLHNELSKGKIFEKANGKEWRFAVVGNIVKSHKGDDGKIYYGTKEFTGGTKVYLDGKYFSSDQKKISVIGLNRHRKYSIETISVALIENLRFKVIFNMTVMEIMDHVEAMDGWKWWGRTANDKREAQEFAKNWYLRKDVNKSASEQRLIERGEQWN